MVELTPRPVAQPQKMVDYVCRQLDKEGCRAKIVVRTPMGERIENVIHFGFFAMNNAAEYVLAPRNVVGVRLRHISNKDPN